MGQPTLFSLVPIISTHLKHLPVRSEFLKLLPQPEAELHVFEGAESLDGPQILLHGDDLGGLHLVGDFPGGETHTWRGGNGDLDYTDIRFCSRVCFSSVGFRGFLHIPKCQFL